MDNAEPSWIQHGVDDILIPELFLDIYESCSLLLEFHGEFRQIQTFQESQSVLDRITNPRGIQICIEVCEGPQDFRRFHSSQKSSFLGALHYFISHLSMRDITAAQAGYSDGSFSPQEKEEYNYSKCTITVRIIEFVTMILDHCQQDLCKDLENELLNNSLWELTASTICNPSSIGFNTADVQVMKNLPDVCVQLLKVVAKSPYMGTLKMCLQTRITMERIENLCGVNLYDPDMRNDSIELGATLSACNQLYRAQLLNLTLQAQVTGLGFAVGSRLLSVVYKGIAAGSDQKSLPSLDISSRRLAEGILQLSFNFGGQCQELVSLLLNTVVLTVPLSGTAQRSLINFSHGEYFYNLFSETINKELLKNLDIVVPTLLKSSAENPKMRYIAEKPVH
ncbi:unnamed protein product [Ranitomeya imitator]|uniref:DNA-dependent protein kinase catalytic subunit CC1/2 domain-containing protein n=1 Tax=Ranitomeya imitator TaxID=111125 RepID=A0ABN9LVJ0_9NEOB|nr:unnamed protein product [Ranitomeya imitator]